MNATIAIESLEARWPGFKLGPVTLTLQPGRVLGLVGPNGAGKSTLICCCAGLVQPSAGGVRVAGIAVQRHDLRWKHELATADADGAFFEGWSAARNLKFQEPFFDKWNADVAATSAARLALPLDKPVRDLSRGNRLKVSLVAALARGAKVLLLDEPTLGLDPIARAEFLELLFDFVRDGERSVLIASNTIADIATVADELAFLHQGHVLLQANKDALVETWGRVTCTLPAAPERSLPEVRETRSSAGRHLFVSSDAAATAERLSQLGATAIETTRLSLEDISIHILKGAKL